MPRRAPNHPLALPPLDLTSDVSLHQQLYRMLRDGILTGRLPPHSRLPSSRALAHLLSLSRNTVLAALEQLQDEGYVVSRQGSGTIISPLPSGLSPTAPIPAADAAESTERPPPRRVSQRAGLGSAAPNRIPRGSPLPLAVGVPALDAFPTAEWSRLLSRRWRRASASLMSGIGPAGYAPLRQAIADHLGGARGVACSPDRIIITAGSQQGLDLAVRALLDPGDLAMVEDPGYTGLRAVLAVNGAVAAPVPVDDHGFDPALAERMWPHARLACITPSHQFPSGATMPADRRLALIQWAARTGGWIIEDDYDSDFRYGGRPLPSLQGLDGGHRTIYCGSFSKSMFPALRLGWLVLPDDLVDPFLGLRWQNDVAPSILPQAAMADFMIEGLFAGHLRKMKTLYDERRQVLKTAADRHLSGLARLTMGEAGTHAIAWLSPGQNDQQIAHDALAMGLAPAPLSHNRFSPGPPALILGYGNTPTARIEEAMRRLASVLSAHAAKTG